MSKRGRQYYDPIVQESYEKPEDFSRIEVFQDPGDPSLRRWCAHYVVENGSLSLEPEICDSDRDRVIAQAKERWPGLDVFELQDPGEDSTWDGTGPSPRLWQYPVASPTEQPAGVEQPVFVDPFQNANPDEMNLRVMPVAVPGNYVLLDDIVNLLEVWAVQYDNEKNPSGALALREATETLKGAF